MFWLLQRVIRDDLRSLARKRSCSARAKSGRRRRHFGATGVFRSFHSCGGPYFCIRNAREVALGPKEIVFVLSIKVGGIDRTGEVRNEHLIAGNVECDADSLHQVRDENFRLRL